MLMGMAPVECAVAGPRTDSAAPAGMNG